MSLQLLYSGAIQNNTPQPESFKSLGGYVSSTPLPNGAVDQLFAPIGRNDVKNVVGQSRLIVLKNISEDSVLLSKVWSTIGTYSTLKLAVVTPSMQGGVPVFEKLELDTSVPFVTLSSHEAEVNALLCNATIASGACVGVWLRRELIMENFNELDGRRDAPILQGDALVQALHAKETLRFDESTLYVEYE